MRGEYKQLAVVVRDALGSMNKDISDVVHSAIGYGVATKLGEMDAVNKQRNELKDKQKDKKEEDIPTAEKDELNEKEKYKLKAIELDKYLNETEKINQAIIKLKKPAIELIESKKENFEVILQDID